MKTRIYVSGKIKKTYRSLELKPLPNSEDRDSHLNSWNANYLTIDNKKCWLLTHTKTRYTVVIPDVTAAKSKELHYWFMDQILNQYLKDDRLIDFEKDVSLNEFNTFFDEFEFYPTNNDKSCIAYLNKRIGDLEWRKYRDGYDGIAFYSFGAIINQIGTMKRNGKSRYIQPVKEMLALIKSIA